MTHLKIVGVVALTVAAVSGVAVSTSVVARDSEGISDQSDREALVRILSRAAHLDRELQFDDVTDLLPNVKYKTEDGLRSASEIVVHGKVSSVEPAFSFYVADAEKSHVADRLPFDDERAQWRTVTLNVKVLDEIGSSGLAGESVRVGLAISNDTTIEDVQKGFQSMESSVFLLARNPEVFNYDDKLYGSLLDGALVIEVRDERLYLPGFERTHGELDPEAGGFTEGQLLREAPTLKDLQRAANSGSRTQPSTHP